MSTITKERLEQLANFRGAPVTRQEEQELARIALASLEAEPVAEVCEGFTLRYIGHGPAPKSGVHIGDMLFTAPPVPVSVPDEVTAEDCPAFVKYDVTDVDEAWARGFNACRAAMLQGVENAETPTTMQTAPALDSSPKIAELPSGNSPVIPDGWVLVPEEPTHEMLEAGDEQFGTYDVYRRMIAAAPQQEVK